MSAEGNGASGGPEGGAVGVVSSRSTESAVSAVDAAGGDGGGGAVDVDLAGCVRRLKSLYVSEKTDEDERMLAKLEQLWTKL